MARRNSGDEEEMTPEERALNNAVREGFTSLLKRHPAWEMVPKTVLGYVDNTTLNKRVDELRKEYRNPHDVYHQIRKETEDGHFLTPEGQELILKKGAHEKANIPAYKGGWARGSLGARRELKDGGDIESAVGSFRKVYQLMNENPAYAQQMPELYASLAEIEKAGFLDVATSILKSEGYVDASFSRNLKERLKEKTQYHAGKAVKEIEKHSDVGGLEQRIAASVLGLGGLGALIFSGLDFTGSAIGISTTSATLLGIGGIILLIIALILLLRILKKKSQTKRLMKKKRR